MANNMEIPEGPSYIVKVIPNYVRPTDEVFNLYQVVEKAQRLDADNATTIVEELVHLAAHLDLASNPVHNDLAGTSLARHFFERHLTPFEPPRSGNCLVLDLVRRYIHIHGYIVWPIPDLFDALRELGFEVVQTRWRWRHVPYQSLWRSGNLLGVYPRNPLSRIRREQEPIMPTWTNPRYCRECIIPYPVWPPKPPSKELLAKLAQWTPEGDIASRYELALAKLSQSSDAYALGKYLATHNIYEVADWFEEFAPLCYLDETDQRTVLSTVLEQEGISLDGETLAGALVSLAAKMSRLGYPKPG